MNRKTISVSYAIMLRGLFSEFWVILCLTDGLTDWLIDRWAEHGQLETEIWKWFFYNWSVFNPETDRDLLALIKISTRINMSVLRSLVSFFLPLAHTCVDLFRNIYWIDKKRMNFGFQSIELKFIHSLYVVCFFFIGIRSPHANVHIIKAVLTHFHQRQYSWTSKTKTTIKR